MRLITIGGVCAAIAVIIVFAASLIPTMKLGAMFCSGLCVLPLLSKHKPWYGLTCHVAAGVLMLIIVPNPVYGLSYLTMFGLYPFVKYIVDKFVSDRVKRLIILCVITLIVIVAAYFAATYVLYVPIILPSWAFFAVIPGAALVVYIEEVVCKWFYAFLLRIKL